MQVKLLTSIFFLGLISSSQLALALDLSKLYEFSVPVRDQSTEERQRAFEVAFRQVLIALSGDRNIIVKDTVQPLFQGPDRFVKQFRYQSAPASAQQPGIPAAATPPSAAVTPGTGAPTTLLLWVQFDENAVSNALKSVKECVWAQRQDVLVWLVIEDRGQRFLVSAESETEFRQLLNDSSERRGVPLLFPLYDLQDQMQLKVSDLWGNFPAPILTTSRRYRTEGVLVGRVAARLGNDWEGRWSLYENNNADQWTTNGATLQEALAGGVDGLADIVAQRYKERYCGDIADHSILLTVLDVKNMQHYMMAQKYLQSLQAVESLSVESIAAERILFRISLRGTIEDLNRGINQDAKLIPITDKGTENPPDSNSLEFRLLP